MNKRDYRSLEREYVISLCGSWRKHGIRSHSSVVDQARRLKWPEKREQYRAKETESFITRHAARQADREAVVRDKALDAIDEALDRFRTDMRATEKKLVNGEWVEVSLMRLKPNDVAILIDRLMVLFDRPSHIGESRALSINSESSVDALSEFLERTRGVGGPSPMRESPLPRRRRLDD